MQNKEPKIYTVSEINRLSQDLLENHFSGVWIEGEISNYRGVASSGHCYFSLKDANAQVDIAAFRGVMSKVKFKLEDGLKVLISGRVTLYPQRGRFQVIAGSIEPRGLGALQLAFEQLKKKLEAEGLFSQERKKTIPEFVGKIGIVTSPTGAALQDILTVIDRRFANVEILIYPAKVQGDGSKDEIAQGIHYLNENHSDLEVLLVGRGGGSIEDLWAFNEEVVARAISDSKIPVISCVGHEIDFTIADFVSDLRAPTPSAAAEVVVKNKSDLLSTLQHCLSRLQQNVQATLDFATERFKGLSRSTVFIRPGEQIDQQFQTLDLLMEKMDIALNNIAESRWNALKLLSSKLSLLSPQSQLEERVQQLKHQRNRVVTSMEHRMEQFRDQLRHYAGQLEALSPLSVLSRGYSIAWTLANNKILKSALQVAKNDSIRIKLHQGEVRAVVQDRFDKGIGLNSNDLESSKGEEGHDKEREYGTKKH